MSAEIIAKLGLNDSKFSAGLTSAEGKFDGWLRRTKAKSADILNGRAQGTSSVDIALRRAQQVSGQNRSEIERARAEHVGSLNRDRLGRALASGRGAIGNLAKKSAAESAGVFEALLPPLPVVERRAGGIMAMLRRKFSAGDLFRDSLRSLGVGLGVGAIANAITTQFSHAADRAKSLATLTESLKDNTLSWLAALGGPTRELELQVKQVNDLNRSIADQRALVESLKSNPLNLVGGGAEQVREAEEELNSLILKQDGLATSAKIAALMENRRTEAIQRQTVHEQNLANIELRHGAEMMKIDERRRALQEEFNILKAQGALPSTLQQNLKEQAALENQRALVARNAQEKRADLERTIQLDREMTAAELKGLSEVEKKQIRLNALRREGDVIRKRHGLFSPESRQNHAEQEALANQIKVDLKAARTARASMASDVTGKVTANQRTFRNGAPRPRSETERLADRADANRQQAENAVLTGQPQLARDSLRAAKRDESSVIGRVSAASRLVGQDQKGMDPAALKGALVDTNTILTRIEASLKVTSVK